MLMSDKINLSYADFHHEITRDTDDTIPKYISSQESQLVRYMSNVPSYLEKGKNFQDNALNIGVLNWKSLEKWQYSQKLMAHKHNGYSPSSSNTSLFSTDVSSTHSSRGPSCSPARQRMRRLSLQSQPEASPKEGYVQDAKASSSRGHSCSPARSHPQKVYAGGGKSRESDVFGGNLGKFEDSTVIMKKHLSRQHQVLGTLQRCERKESVSEMGQGSTSDKYEVAAPWKGKTKIQVIESTKQTLKLQETKVEANGRLPTVADHMTISGKNDFEKSLPYKSDNNNKHPEPTCSQNPESVKNSSLASHISLHSTKIFHNPYRINAQGVRGPSQASHMLSFPVRMLSSPSRSRNTEEKKPVAGTGSASVGKPSQDQLHVRKSSESIPKTRNPSPIRRLSSAMGKMIKNAGSRDNSPLRRSTATSDGAIAPSIDNPCCNNSSNNNNRSRSSPLRRLLDPLLKSRVSNSSELSKKHSSPAVGSIKSCNDPSDFCAGNSVKVKCSDSHHNSKAGSLSLQALLQVSFKNGFPLFTFAIDNESNILAATVRKSFVPGKGHHNWTYTFFTVREIKRKSGIWLNHGEKGDRHGYVPNIVAQMKVSDSRDSPFTKHENDDDHFTREFDLFAVDVGHGDHYATDFQPTNELAAIVVKLSRTSNGDPSKHGESSYSWLDLSQPFAGSDDDLPNHHPPGSLNLRSTTVILPGGVHTVPSKGEISTLAQRWKSGGSCDCGGWDLGCQLRVYTNQKEYERKMASSVTCLSEDKFQLFSQVGQDNQPMLSLGPFKERIYSVEFNSSLSLLQAFAVCISFIDCKRPAELSEPSNVVEKTGSDIGVFEVPTPMKTSNHHQVGAPARYASYPPHSPVGRV